MIDVGVFKRLESTGSNAEGAGEGVEWRREEVVSFVRMLWREKRSFARAKMWRLSP